MTYFLKILILTASFHVMASDLTEMDYLKQMTKGYSSTPYLIAKFKQKQTLELLGDVKKSKGELYYSNQKLRLELEGEETSVTLFTPGVITSISYDKKNKPIQVLRSKPYPHPLLSLIFGKEETWDDFKITKTKVNNKNILEVEVRPKNPKSLRGVDRIELVLAKKSFEIKKITYWDDLGNEISNEFTSQKRKDKVDGTQFILVPPAGLEIKTI